MPNQYWRHVCDRCDALEGGRACRRCGADGTFSHWGLSMWESAAVYRYVYELNPFGSHRPLSNALLNPMREHCVGCGGRAIVSVGETEWQWCGDCEGTGGVWIRALEEVEAAKQAVLNEYPAAALPWAPARTPRRSA